MNNQPTGNSMTKAQSISFNQIISAAQTGRHTITRLGVIGRVPGRFGLTAMGAVLLIKKMIANGDLRVVYDSLNCSFITAP